MNLSITCKAATSVFSTGSLLALLQRAAESSDIQTIEVDVDHKVYLAPSSEIISNRLWGVDEVDGRAVLELASAARTESGTCVGVYVLDTGCTPYRKFSLCHGVFTNKKDRGCEYLHGHWNHVAGSATNESYDVVSNAITPCIKIMDQKGVEKESYAVAGIKAASDHFHRLGNTRALITDFIDELVFYSAEKSIA